MAGIRNFGFAALLRSEASSYVIRYRNGRPARAGRGLSFWFRPQRASIAELPMDDRETALFVKGRSKDFQDVAVQGRISWRVADPQRLADRVDFTIGLFTGSHKGEPIDQIESRFGGLGHQAAAQYLMERPVRDLLDSGLEPLRQRIEAALIHSPALTEIGVETITVRLSSIAPSSELERALQTPTFEALQQKADEAMFERRALAVDKERAIAENELANKVELARREKQLIAEEADNAHARAVAAAEAGQVAAAAEAERIRSVEGARAEAEQGHMAVYRDLPPEVLLGLAARDFAAKLETINELNVTPDLIASLFGEFRKAAPAVLVDAR